MWCSLPSLLQWAENQQNQVHWQDSQRDTSSLCGFVYLSDHRKVFTFVCIVQFFSVYSFLCCLALLFFLLYFLRGTIGDFIKAYSHTFWWNLFYGLRRKWSKALQLKIQRFWVGQAKQWLRAFAVESWELEFWSQHPELMMVLCSPKYCAL